MAGKELQEKVDRTALILNMSTSLKTASDRWAEVCRIYDGAWKTAFESHAKILEKVQSIKKKREQEALDRLKLCIELAFVFLPIVGGEAAIALAPILTARGKLLANHIERQAQAAWSEFAARSPITSKVVKEIGTRSAKEAKDAAEKIKNDIIEKLAPKYVKVKALAANTNPLDAFIDNNNLTRGEMNKWVESCSEWNVKGTWERELVPVAHELFLNHPWIRTAPPEQTTQEMRAQLTLFIEMALWLRWARRLDEEYWRKIHEWYVNEYSSRSRDGKYYYVDMNKSWVRDALDYRVLWEHLRRVYPKMYKLHGMTLLDPDSGIVWADTTTIDLWVMIRYAKHNSGDGLLYELKPPGARIYSGGLLRELGKM